MPNTPQPGRIPTPQSTGKISGAPLSTGGSTENTSANPITPSSTGGAVAEIAGAAQDPVGALTSKATEKFVASDSQKRYKKALNEAHRSGRTPTKPEYRITLIEAGILIAISLVIDLAQFILGLLVETGIGEVINIVVDILVGIALAAYCAIRLKMSFAAHWQRYASILLAGIVEDLPVINICAAWTFDVWYIIHTIRAEDKETFQRLTQTLEKERQEDTRQEFIENYQAQRMQQQLQIQEEQEENEQEEELEAVAQEKTWQNDGGVGRIAPLKLKTAVPNPSQKPFYTQPTGKPASNSGIIK